MKKRKSKNAKLKKNLKKKLLAAIEVSKLSSNKKQEESPSSQSPESKVEDLRREKTAPSINIIKPSDKELPKVDTIPY